jgi:hypothetical protein
MCGYYGECVDTCGDFCDHCFDVREGRAEFNPGFTGSYGGRNDPAPIKAMRDMSNAVGNAMVEAAEKSIEIPVRGAWEGFKAGWKAGK